ncbi:RNA polymerase sigma factor [Niabella ginsengisoli]|uniref:RNA polymerase sigma factor n=1 Tax=Niabella ginsengisoli TaxID=522298 RepID=A0ABS9SQ62_9BACT|nr:RNA polymerase sigma factor [Niabella ginsengisoli]MCH5600538.1 RNA polymerase sigma factor [Niabella ginsengisoli]
MADGIAIMADDKKQNIVDTVTSYSKRLFGFIRGKVNTDADAEDILQDVWYQFANTSATQTIEEVSGWLFAVARNKITDRYRKKKPDLIDDYQYEGEDGEFHFKDILLAINDNPELEDFKELFWESLFDALEELPVAQREAFILNELEDMTLQEIADKSGESIKTVISRKRYAVQHLRKRLQFLYNELSNF